MDCESGLGRVEKAGAKGVAGGPVESVILQDVGLNSITAYYI